MFLSIMAVMFFCVYTRENGNNVELHEIFDLTLITSFIVLFIVKIISDIISKYLRNCLEDSMKLEVNYSKFTKMYPLEDGYVVHSNNKSSIKNRGVKKSRSKAYDGYNYKIPILELYQENLKDIDIRDNRDKKYQLPELAKNNYELLLGAHSTSTVYNQINIRLDSIEAINQTLLLNTSRTTYFDSLVTNRALDFDISNGITLRKLLNPGPYVSDLSESLLSNHIGFNIFVGTKESSVVFVKRSNNVSIAKKTLGPSIAASLKAKYCLDENRQFSLEGFLKAIVKEIRDELGLEIVVNEFSFEENYIGFYRDVLEGGKPQFLFKYSSNISEKEIIDKFKNQRNQDKDKSSMLTDGNKLVFISTNNFLENIFIAPDLIMVLEDKKIKSYSTVPSVSGTFSMYLKSLAK